MTRSRETSQPSGDPRDLDEGGWDDFLSEHPREPPGSGLAPLETPPQVAGTALALPPVVRATESLTLEQIVTRQAPVQWAEAVAIVQELCRILLLDQSGPDGVPEPGDVAITSDGQVIVAPGSRGTGDVNRLSQTLHTLLPVSSTPLALRLFVTSSMSSERYGSIGRFAEALAHYAATHVDRAELIRAVFRRSVVFTPGALQAPRAEAGAVLEAPAEPGRRLRLHLGVVAAAVAALLLGTSAVLLMVAPRTEVTVHVVPPPAVVSPTVEVLRVVEPLQVPLEPPAREAPRPAAIGRRDAGAEAQPAASEVPVVSPAPASSALGPPAHEGEGGAAPPPSPPTLQALPIAPSSPTVSRAPPTSDQLVSRTLREPSGGALDPAVPPAPVATAGTAPDPRIYTRDDHDVEPPVALSPGPPTPPGLADHVTNVLLLVIDERGRVKSAKWLQSPSQRLIDAVVPQSAKNMKFRPALRNGKAVQYLLQMPLTTTPPQR